MDEEGRDGLERDMVGRAGGYIGGEGKESADKVVGPEAGSCSLARGLSGWFPRGCSAGKWGKGLAAWGKLAVFRGSATPV
jgi:hypothetical protein